MIIFTILLNLAFLSLAFFYFIKSYRHKAKEITDKIKTKVKNTLDRSRSQRYSGNTSSDQSKNSFEAKDTDRRLSDIIDQLPKLDNEELDISKRKSSKDDDLDPYVPSELGSENPQIMGSYKDNTDGNNCSIIRNSVYGGALYSSQSSGLVSPVLITQHNSMRGLLSPAQDSDRSEVGISFTKRLPLFSPSRFNQQSNRGSNDSPYDSPVRNSGASYEDSPMSRDGPLIINRTDSILSKKQSSPFRKIDSKVDSPSRNEEEDNETSQ